MDIHAVNSCVRGFHVYYDRWTPYLGEFFMCKSEGKNANGLYTVAIKKGSEIIGHMPREISAACNLFLEFGGLLCCVITDTHHRYSADLPQGDYRSHASSSLRALKVVVALCPKFEDWCQCDWIKFSQKAPKRSVKVAGTSESVKLKIMWLPHQRTTMST